MLQWFMGNDTCDALTLVPDVKTTRVCLPLSCHMIGLLATIPTSFLSTYFYSLLVSFLTTHIYTIIKVSMRFLKT